MGLLDGMAWEQENPPQHCLACRDKDERYGHTCKSAPLSDATAFPADKIKVGDTVVRADYTTRPMWLEFCLKTGKQRHDTFVVTWVSQWGGHMKLDDVDGTQFSTGNFKVVNPPAEPVVDEMAEPKSDLGVPVPAPIYTGGSSDYYQVDIKSPTTPYRIGYTAECNDIIEALGMNFAEGNAFKALWRRAAQRTLGLRKAGAKDDGLYDAEKVEFFGKRLVEQAKNGRA